MSRRIDGGHRKSLPHRYLADPLTVDEHPADYFEEEGVLIDRAERPWAFPDYDRTRAFRLGLRITDRPPSGPFAL